MDTTLDFFGIFQVQLLYVILGLLGCIVILLILLILTMSRQKALKRTLEKFMTGKDAKSLESLVTTRFAEIDALKDAEKKNRTQIRRINESLKFSYSKTGIVKYDAFHEMGGKLSFALAVLDNRNNGYIINAMHSREGCYTYIKEIINGESYIVLGEEEKEALEKALHQDMDMETKKQTS